MESMKEMFGSNISDTDARHNRNSIKSNERKANTANVRVFSVDKVTVEKIILESSNGSRKVLLTKNETLRKFALSSASTGVEQQKSTNNDRFQISVPEDSFISRVKDIVSDNQSKLPILRSRKSDDISPSNEENRITPIKFIRSPSISSIIIDSSNSANVKRSKVQPKVPGKTATVKGHSSSLKATSVPSTRVESFKDLLPNREKIIDKITAEVKQKQSEQEIPEGKDTENDEKSDNSISCTGIEKYNKTFEVANIDRSKTKKIKKQKKIVEESREKNARFDKNVQYHLEKSQVTIEDLQNNLRTSFHASTVQSAKEESLGLRVLRPSITTNCGERLSAELDKDFLKRHNLHKRLKIEEKRLLETDLDYVSDNNRISESEDRLSVKLDTERQYSAKVTEVEKRWSGEFLVRCLQCNSSESSKSSYVEEFSSVSSHESIVEDRDTRLLFNRKASPPTKFAERSTSTDESKKQTSDEAFENSTVSIVDSDSCLEDRIKAVDEDIAHVTNEIQTKDNNDIDEFDRAYDNIKDEDRWNKKIDGNKILTITAIVHNQKNQSLKKKNFNDTTDVDCYNNPNTNAVKSNCEKNIGNCVLKIPCIKKNFLTEKRNNTNIDFATAVNSEESIDSTFVLQDHRKISGSKDGYANLVKEFTMEVESSKMKKEEKQKRKLGFRHFLPAIFSPKDSRKEYKKKEQKERKRYDERHFARYQQNGNYTRSPDTMNLNEDIKRNVKLDSSLNGSIIDERLNQIKRELFPEQQGPITSTPDHFLQTMDDTRLLRQRGKGQRSYTTDSSLSSIAPDERCMDRGATHISVLSDFRKYEQQQRQEERDGNRRYGRHMLERKHSLQEPNHNARSYFFQRNHAASGRISAPPSERYLMRSRAIHPVDRPLPAIPQSRVELSNYENYEEDRLCDDLGSLNVADNGTYQNQPGLYRNDRSLETSLIHGSVPQSVPAQVKITRQPIVNQTQRAPLIGRKPKYPSPESSQKSGDYADSSCTPNSSQKSEFSPSSSKSGEYYLNSPRSSARTSPIERPPFEDTQERIYENEARSTISQSSSNYADEHVYDKTPSSPCREEHFSSMKTLNHTTENLPEKKNDLYKQKSSNEQSSSKNSILQFYEHNKAMQTKLKQEIEKSREDSLRNHEQTNTSLKNNSSASVPNVSPSKRELTAAASPGSRTRRSQPNDQILIASPKREEICQSRVSRPSNETKFCDAESPILIADSHDSISSIASINVRDQYGSQNLCAAARSMELRTASSSGLPKGISRPEPIYGQCKQRQSPSRNNVSDTNKDGRENNQSPSRLCSPPESHCNVNEKVDQTQNHSSVPRNPQLYNSEVNQVFNEPERRVARSPIRELLNAWQGVCQQHQPDVIAQQHTLFVTSTSPSNAQPSPIANQNKVHAESISSLQHESIYERHLPQQYQHPRQQDQEAIYVQRVTEATCDGQQNHSACGMLSSMKQETRQHLEAFYWQQKALEAHRKSAASPLASSRPRQTAPKIDLPEMREAVYWQQLKRLDEEQQRRIYEQNLITDGVYETHYKMRTGSPMLSPNRRTFSLNAMIAPGSVVHRDGSYGINAQHQPHLKINPTGKLSLMLQMQKGQNQPVLIVRPQQQALRDHHESMSIKLAASSAGSCNTSRSKSASPHFHKDKTESRSDLTCEKSFTERSRSAASPRRPEVHGATNEENSTDGESKRPHPIFKRGSLIGGDLMDYGNTGPKRVSFSNQSNIVGPDLAATGGNWPTKHGTAAEPPTRRHRSEDSASDTDSVFLHQDRCDAAASQNIVSSGARNASPAMKYRMDINNCLEQEYDANRPLPPLPKDSLIISRRRNGARNYVCNDVRWNGEEQRSCRRRQEEEWNPDGKGRQSNDTGGSIRGEIDLSSNELTPGRRPGVGGSGGGGGGVGVGGGGSVLGVGAGGGGSGGGSGGRSSSGSGRSRDEPRRHTLGGNDHQASLHHQQFNAQQLHPLHPHHLPPPHGQYGTPPTRHTTMDLEMGTKSRQRKSPLPRGYPPPSSTMLFDDDPGIMSEVETSSTGFRRGGKQRSSLPVVRTPSKTLERPLGLVFLQYRNETKRALLPNEITSIDTVKALFVRSFPKQLTMEYLDSPHVKVYIHDSNKDMFYELEDIRSHLRDIKDRSVLRLFESADGMTGMPGPLGMPGGGGLPPHWEDQSYFSEPEFDSEYQHQHIHKSKTAKNSTSGSGYYVGGSSTLPRGGSLLRAYSPATSSVVGGPNATPTQTKTLTTPGGGGVPPAKPLRSYQCGKSPLGSLGGSARFSRDSSVSLYSIPDRLHGESGYMSSPERGAGVGSGSGRYPPGPYSAGSSYEDPYYSQYSGTVTPVIDEEASDTELLEESYSLYGVKPPGRSTRSPFPSGAATPLPAGGPGYDATRIRVEHMERQLANLTGLVQKALTHAPHTSPSPREYLQVPPGRDPYGRTAGVGDEFDKHSSSSSASLPVSQPAVTDDSYLRTDVKPPKLGKDKSVSFEKSVSFSDEPPDMNSPKQHSPQHAADTKPTKPAIKSSTLPRMSSQERDRHKPTPPPKPAALVTGQYVYRDLALTPEMYNQLRGLQKKAKDLRQEVRNLRRMSQAQAHTVRETIKDTFITIRAMLLSGGDTAWTAGDTEKIRLSREEDLYKQEMIRLEKDLTELESTVEELRGNVINRKTRVNMSDVENMALILSKSSKTVADLKVRFPSLQEGMKGLLSSEMEKVVREEKFLKEEPERLESALRRCKKLTGTLVTLKRLASVQEQRLPNAASVDAEDTPPITPTSAQHSKAAAPVPAERTVVGSAGILGGGGHPHESSADHQQRPENALDALLDELQTFSRPSSQMGHVSGGLSVHHPSGNALLADIGRASSLRESTTTILATGSGGGIRAPSISDIGRKGSVDSSSGALMAPPAIPMGLPGTAPGASGTLRRLHSYPSSSDTDTSPPIARLQALSLQDQQQQQPQPGMPMLPQVFLPGQKPPVPERNAELLQLASARRVPPPPPPRTSSRSPLASPTSPQLPPRNHPCSLQSGNATLRRPTTRAISNSNVVGKEGKLPMALPPDATAILSTVDQQATTTPSGAAIVSHNSLSSQSATLLSTSNSSSCESVNSQEGLQSKRGRQEQLEQRHQELLKKQKALQEQYARLQQLQRNAAGLTTVPPAPPDLLKKTGSESNLLAKMGLGLSAASSGSLTSLSVKPQVLSQEAVIADGNQVTKIDVVNGQTSVPITSTVTSTTMTTNGQIPAGVITSTTIVSSSGNSNTITNVTTTTSKVYETDIL